MRLENDFKKVKEFEEGMHSNCDKDLSLTQFFLISFICEEVDSISIWTEVQEFAQSM